MRPDSCHKLFTYLRLFAPKAETEEAGPKNEKLTMRKIIYNAIQCSYNSTQ